MSATRSDAAAPETATPPGAELVPVEADDLAPVTVKRLPFFLGRHDECDLVLRGEGVMRKHAKIRWADGHYLISDLATYQGTYVNGDPILEVALKDGDLIRIGTRKLCFKLAQAPQAAPAAPLPPELTAAVRAHAVAKRPSVLRAVPGWVWAAAAGSLAILGVGVRLNLQRQHELEVRRAPVTLGAVRLTAGESTFREVPLPRPPVSDEERAIAIEDPVVASVSAVPDGVVIEGINPGSTRVTVRLPDYGPRIVPVEISAVADPLDAYPDLKGILTLGPAARVEKAESFLTDGDRHIAARDENLGGRSLALDEYRKAVLILDSLPNKPSLLDVARKKLDEVKKDLDAQWTDHYFQMVQAFRVGDTIKAREHSMILLQIFPEPQSQRNAIAHVYLDRLRK